jgi:hypothetical protein
MSLSWIPSIVIVHLSRVPIFCSALCSWIILVYDFVYFNSTDNTQQWVCALKPLIILHAIPWNLQHDRAFIQKLIYKTDLLHLGDWNIGTALYNGPNTPRLTSFATGSAGKFRCSAITWFIVDNRDRKTDYLFILIVIPSTMFCFVNLVLYLLLSFVFCHSL